MLPANLVADVFAPEMKMRELDVPDAMRGVDITNDEIPQVMPQRDVEGGDEYRFPLIRKTCCACSEY